MCEWLSRTITEDRVGEGAVPRTHPPQHGGSRRRGLAAAPQRLAGLDQAEGFRGIDAERFQHRGRQHLAHAALECQAPVCGARPGRLAAALGGEIKQAALVVVQLREQEATPVAEFRIVGSELVAVVAQRQRLLEILRQWLESPEMRNPFLVAQHVEPDGFRRALITIAQDVIGKFSRRDDIVELGTERGMAGRGAVMG